METLKDLCQNIRLDNLTEEYLVPINWCPQKDGALYPLPADLQWKSLELLGKELDITGGILCTFPLIWQLEPLAHKVARSLSVPIAVTSPQNLPLTIPYVNEANIDIILTAPECLSKLFILLEKANRKPKAIVVVHKNLEGLSITHPTISIIHELHLVPGFVLAYQTASLARESTQRFKLSDTCVWDIHDDGSVRISTAKNIIAPFKNLVLPFKFIEEGTTKTFSIQL